jgi:hypothetical protein
MAQDAQTLPSSKGVSVVPRMTDDIERTLFPGCWEFPSFDLNFSDQDVQLVSKR